MTTLKGFSHRKLIFDMLFPLKGYAKKVLQIYYVSSGVIIKVYYSDIVKEDYPQAVYEYSYEVTINCL